MQDENDPWKRDSDEQSSGSSLGFVLWVGLLVSVGLGIWLLSSLFPGQLSTDGDSSLEIVRLVGLLALVSSGLLLVRRINVGEVVRNIAVWVGLAALVMVGYSFRAELEQIYYRVSGELVPSRAVSLGEDELVIAESTDGHFYIDGRANGQRVRFLIDTGASGVTLSPRDASRIGVDLDRLQFTQRFETANGIGFGAAYRLDSMSMGPFVFTDVPVSINSAEMGTSLLGMSVLERLDSFEFRDGKLYLRR